MLHELYYTRLAAAAVLGSVPVPEALREIPLDAMTDQELEQLFRLGKEKELKLYRFKKTH